MKFNTIPHTGEPKLVKIGQIKDFENKCVVTGIIETCNLELEYVPNKKLVELGSYRKYFEGVANLSIEDFADKILKDFCESVCPKSVKIELFMNDKNLTPWSVIVKK